MSEDEQRIKTPVKELSKEITQKYIRQIVREATERAVKKQIEKLKENDVLKLEGKLKNLSDEQKIGKFKGSFDEVTKQIFQGGMKDTELIEKISTELGNRISSILLPTTKILIAIAVSSILVVTGAYIFFQPGAPLASIDSITPNPAFAQEVVMLNGSGMTAKQGDYIKAYRWESDKDGVIGNSKTLETSSLSVGNHTITFYVEDNHDKWSGPAASQIEILQNHSPIAYIDFIRPTSVYTGTSITFSGHGTDPDTGDPIIAYEWSINNTILSNSDAFSTQNLTIGVHIIQFRVKDYHGAWSEPVTDNIEIKNHPPIAYIDSIQTGTRVIIGTPIVFSGHGTDPDKNDSITDYEWSINNTILSNMKNFTDKSLPIGKHAIHFRVNDNHGTWSETVIAGIEIIPDPTMLRLPRIWNESWAVVPYIWNGYNFAEFFYDLKSDRFTETLSINQKLSGSTIPEKSMYYNTTKADVQFKVNDKESHYNPTTGQIDEPITVDGDQTYKVVGWQAEKWIAIKNMANKLAKLVFEMEKEDKKTLTTGETWALGAGYEITINAVDARATPRQVWFTLKKDGAVIDEGIGQAPQSGMVADKQKAVYFKKLTILGEPGALLFTVYVDSIFSGATSDMVQFKYAWLIDQGSAMEIKTSDMFGVFEVTRADSDSIALRNKNSVTLSKNSATTLIGNMKFMVADNDTLRFMPVVAHTQPGSYEIRGNVWGKNPIDGFGAYGSTATWNVYNFEGFFYDLDDNLGKEKLDILQTNLAAGQRTIENNALVYSTAAQPIRLKVVKYAFNNDIAKASGLCCTEPGGIFENGFYSVAGWQGNKYIAVNGKINKLAKLIMEQGSSEKKSLTVGEIWDIGEGWNLTVISIDSKASPGQARFELNKFGVKKDDVVVFKGSAYTYIEKSFNGESNVPIFITYVDSVFAGATSDMVQLRYTWVMSTNVLGIKTGDKFGVFKVVSIDSNGLLLRNTDTSVDLSQDSVVDLMDNLRFRIADGKDILRLYPKVDFVASQ